MRKRGFTLAELLIVLGIAGVVAAVILPAINGLMPDKTKINYLKVYDELGKNIKALTSDSSIFPVLLKEGSTDIDVSKYPLVNNSQPLKAPFKDDTKYSGDNKLCNLLAHTFGVDSCNTTSYPDNSSFTTPNGMEWWISQTKREIDTVSNKIAYQTDIYVDVDSSKKSSNCMYGEENCKQPDRFKFLLAADGRLVPADPVGVHYINTRKNLLKKKFDVEGEVLASLDDVDFNNGHSNNIDNSVADNNEPIDNDVEDNVTEPPKDNEPPATDNEEPESTNPACRRVLTYSHTLHGQWTDNSSKTSLASKELSFSHSIWVKQTVAVVGETDIGYPDTGIYEIEVSPITFTAEYREFKDTTVGPGWNIPQLVTSSYTVTREAKRFALLPYNIKIGMQLTPFESTADKNLILVPHAGLNNDETSVRLMYIYEDLDNPNVCEERFKVLSAPEIVDIKYIPINSKQDAASYLNSKGVKHFAMITKPVNFADCKFEFQR